MTYEPPNEHLYSFVGKLVFHANNSAYKEAPSPQKKGSSNASSSVQPAVPAGSQQQAASLMAAHNLWNRSSVISTCIGDTPTTNEFSTTGLSTPLIPPLIPLLIPLRSAALPSCTQSQLRYSKVPIDNSINEINVVASCTWCLGRVESSRIFGFKMPYGMLDCTTTRDWVTEH